MGFGDMRTAIRPCYSLLHTPMVEAGYEFACAEYEASHAFGDDIHLRNSTVAFMIRAGVFLEWLL